MFKRVSGILQCQNSNSHECAPGVTARAEECTWGEYEIPLSEDALSEKSNQPEKALPKDRVNYWVTLCYLLHLSCVPLYVK